MKRMAESNVARKWEDLPPDVLGMIFKPLSIEDIFGAIPLVCKSWGEVVRGPYCSREIDIEGWTSRPNVQPALKVDKMIRVLISRSSGPIQKLCVSNLSLSRTFDFIAEHVGSLHTLKVPGGLMSDAWIQNVAANLVNVTYLDLSYCNNISASGLEIIGRNCPSLSRLNRNMYPLHDIPPPNDEVVAIASTMPSLKHLELVHGAVDTWDVMLMIQNCSKLEYLDITGCWMVILAEQFLQQHFPKLQVMGPGPYEHILWEF